MESELNQYPAVRYHPDGRTMRVLSPAQDKQLATGGWSPFPFPPPPEPEKRLDVQSQIDVLTERFAALERILKTKKVS